jgi:hypothetical protein
VKHAVVLAESRWSISTGTTRKTRSSGRNAAIAFEDVVFDIERGDLLDIQPYDTVGYVGALLSVAAAGIAASLRNVQKAVAVDPVTVLRCDWSPLRAFGTYSHLEAENAALEGRLKGWPTPSLVPLTNNWIGNLGAAYFFQVPNNWRNRPVNTLADAYLYLGPLDSLKHEPTPPDILADQDYMNELQRRKAIGGTTFNGFSLAEIRQADADPHFYRRR